MTAEIQAAVKERKGSVQSPKQVIVVDSVPVTALGKPDKKSVRAQFWGRRPRGGLVSRGDRVVRTFAACQGTDTVARGEGRAPQLNKAVAQGCSRCHAFRVGPRVMA